MAVPHSTPHPRSAGNWYQRVPMPLRIVIALALGCLLGMVLTANQAHYLKPVSDMVLRMLGLLATPLIFLAVIRSLVTTRIAGRKALMLFGLLMMNTVVAILVGIAVANTIRPGEWTEPDPPQDRPLPKNNPVQDLLNKLIPTSFLRPLTENDILGLIILALALGVALRQVRASLIGKESESFQTFEHLLEIGFRTIMVMLHWVFELVPFAVLAVVAHVVGTKGFGDFVKLGGFIIAVLIALSLQLCYYLTVLWVGSRFTPWQFLRGGADAFLTAFSTASSAATLPITYSCATQKLGVSDDSASLGVMVGGTFNHDGTALYEAMAALFIAQWLGMDLSMQDQVLLVIMAVFASVGAAGIPEAGLVTMVAVFTAVGLPPDKIPLLLTVDWFLDRCRTAINVMGDLSVTCLVDGRSPSPRLGDSMNSIPAGQEPSA